MLESHFLIGEILRPQGIKGELKVRIYSNDIENIKEISKLYLNNNNDYSPINIESIKLHSGEYIIKIQSVDDRNAAEALRGKQLFISRADASPLNDGEYYISDIIGSKVVSAYGKEIGLLKDVLTDSPKDIYVLKTNDGEMMFPLISGVIKNVDLAKKLIFVNEELLEELAVINKQ